MPRNNPTSLCDSIIAAHNLSARVVVGPEASASWSELVGGSVLNERFVEASRCSVVLAESDQFWAGAALVQLDGIARRIVLCPPDLS